MDEKINVVYDVLDSVSLSINCQCVVNGGTTSYVYTVLTPFPMDKD